MMFDYAFGLKTESELIRKAVNASMDANVRTQDIQVEREKAYGTAEVGEWIVRYIREAEK
jgi:3-isopropylmalate dehydrogenase